jgi:hypothetical protein
MIREEQKGPLRCALCSFGGGTGPCPTTGNTTRRFDEMNPSAVHRLHPQGQGWMWLRGEAGATRHRTHDRLCLCQVCLSGLCDQKKVERHFTSIPPACRRHKVDGSPPQPGCNLNSASGSAMHTVCLAQEGAARCSSDDPTAGRVAEVWDEAAPKVWTSFLLVLAAMK